MALKKVRIFLEMIKFEHTIFALPFAFVGAMLVNKEFPNPYELFWITLAMVGARTAAMSLNRLIDHNIDAINPRTKDRALPKGLIKVSEIWFYVLLSFTLLFISAYQLSPLAFKLFPVAVFFLSIYSFTKRFTWSCHLFLGIALGLAPLGSWIAISNSFHTAPVLLALGVLFWVAGFDIIYACDDYDFDRHEGINSIPARFGIKKALQISSFFHILAPLLFSAIAFVIDLGLFYILGVLISVIILFYEHSLVKPDDLSKAGVAFMNLNGTLSMVVFCFTLLDLIYPIQILP